MAKVAVITCSVGRPKLLELCKHYVQRQTHKPDLYIIQDQDQKPFPNYIDALGKVPPDHHVLFMDDDDWYAPTHIENLLTALDVGSKLVAPCVMRRMHIPSRRFHVQATDQPGPAMCGVHVKYVSRYRELLRFPRGDRLPWVSLGAVAWSEPTYVGIKGVGHGLPGKAGITAKHSNFYNRLCEWKLDKDFKILSSWIGEEDVNRYRELLKGK